MKGFSLFVVMEVSRNEDLLPEKRVNKYENVGFLSLLLLHFDIEVVFLGRNQIKGFQAEVFVFSVTWSVG